MGEVPPQVLTVTSTVEQAIPVGDVTVSCVDEATTTFVPAVDPNCTVGVPKKLVPFMVIVSPPAEVPVLGLTLVTVGAATPLE